MTARWPFQSRLPSLRQMALTCLALVSLLFGSLAWAHSSSNSYLTLSMPSQQLTLRADFHVRDLDLIFDLDRDRDGQVTWAETQARSAELSAWLVQGISLSASDQRCTLGQADLQASQHADGIYLSALWTPLCPGVASPLDETRFTLGYDLIFSQDNLHRGLLTAKEIARAREVIVTIAQNIDIIRYQGGNTIDEAFDIIDARPASVREGIGADFGVEYELIKELVQGGVINRDLLDLKFSL